MIAAPRSDAIVKRLPVRVALRVPANTTRLRVRLGRRTSAFDPMTQSGYGVSLADFIWEKYKAPFPSVSCYT